MATPDPQQTLLELEKRDLSPEGLWQAAQDANVALEQEELAVLDESAWIRDQRYRIERVEMNHTMNVFAAKVDPDDPESKPLYTNDTSRKAEVSRRVSVDPVYKELMAALLVAEKNQAVRKIKIDRLTRDYQLSKLAYAGLMLGRRGLGEIEP